MSRVFFHLSVVILLTLLSQLGGLAWIVALCFRKRILAFVAAYATLSVTALWVAPVMGREPLPCISGDALKMQSTLFCVLNRQYVTPELKVVLHEFANRMESTFPDTTTRILDANFPFVSGFPLLPHLSHNDGRKVDLAFYYQDDSGYLPDTAKSPIGYFAFEDGPTDCPRTTLSLRWDFAWLQPFWPDYELEPLRMTAALKWLGSDNRIGKVFIEPHLAARFNASSSRIRFQGCRAARHDDHLHIQL